MKKVLSMVLVASMIFSAFTVSIQAKASGFASNIWDGFVNPSQEHKTTALWFWNDYIETMTEEKVRTIVRESFKQSGYNGFGILPAFLSTSNNFVFANEKFYQMYGAALDEAKKHNMQMALYDEDGWPSGSAGGLLQNRYPNYTTRRLDKYEAAVSGGQTVKIPAIAGNYIGSILMNTDTFEVTDISDSIAAILDASKIIPTTTASSSYATGNYGAANATDGNESTRWNAASGVAMPQWLEIDFKQDKTFNKIEIVQPYKENPALVRITGYNVQVWNGTGWNIVATGTTIGESKVIPFNTVTTSKVRFVVTSVTTSSPSICMFKVFNNDQELTPIVPPTTDYKIPMNSGNYKLMVFNTVSQGNKGLDYLNPNAVKAYISLTYEQFYKRFADYFGTTIKKSFYDEPTMVSFREAGTTGNRTWTDNFNKMFEDRYPGENAMLYYPALFGDMGAKTQEARDKLLTARSDMFATSFIKQMDDWCREHGIQYMGHLYSEETVNPVSISGDLMRTFKYQSIPGIDHIGNSGNTHDISRVITSSAYNWDKPLVMSETYGAAGAGMPVNDLYIWAMDEYAAGVNLIIPHAVWYNDATSGPYPNYVFYPPELSYRNSKYAAELPKYNEYMGRLNQMLQGGRHVADIGIVYPIDYLENSFIMNSDSCNPADANYKSILTTLAYNINRDFTFLHPEVIDEKCSVEGNVFKLNNPVNFEEYNTIILPGMKVISLSNLVKINEFLQAGGKVISIGQLPYKGIKAEENAQVEALSKQMFGVDPITSAPLDGSQISGFYKKSAQNGGVAYYAKTVAEATLRQMLDDANKVYDVNITRGSVSGGRFSYIHKIREGTDIYFLANSGSSVVKGTADLRGRIVPSIWNPHNGTMSVPQYEYVDIDGTTVTRVSFNMPATTSIFIVDSPTIGINNPQGIKSKITFDNNEKELPYAGMLSNEAKTYTVASNDSKYAFSHWMGDVVSNSNPITIESADSVSIDAIFKYVGGELNGETATLAFDAEEGTAIYINGKSADLPFEQSFEVGTELVIDVVPPVGKYLTGWEGAPLLGSPAFITVNGDISAKPIFAKFPDSTNYALNKPVASNDSLSNASWNVSFINDGVTTGTGYSSMTDYKGAIPTQPVYIDIDLGANTYIDRVVLYPRTDAASFNLNMHYFPQDYTISVRADGSDTYETVAQEIGHPDTAEPQEYTFDLVSARYVRLAITKFSPNSATNDAKRAQLAEIEVYGPSSYAAAKEIKITAPKKYIEIGEALNLNALVSPSDVVDNSVSWYIHEADGKVFGALSGKARGVVSGNEMSLIGLASGLVDVVARANDGSGALGVFRVAIGDAGDDMITSISPNVSTVVSGCSANVIVSVTGDDLDEYGLKISMFGKEAEVVNGIAVFKLASSDIPNVTEKTAYNIDALIDGKVVKSGVINVYPNNEDIWAMTAVQVDEKLELRFSTAIAPKYDRFGITVGGVSVEKYEINDDANVIIIDCIANKGDEIVVKGVWLVDLFPSYSFTYAAKCN